MSVESAKDFLKKYAKDGDFRAKLEGAASNEDRKKMTKDAGFDFTKEELKEAMGGSAELSDEDLEKVSGGNAPEWVAVGVVVASAF